jgi:hypothetical protein
MIDNFWNTSAAFPEAEIPVRKIVSFPILLSRAVKWNGAVVCCVIALIGWRGTRLLDEAPPSKRTCLLS